MSELTFNFPSGTFYLSFSQNKIHHIRKKNERKKIVFMPPYSKSQSVKPFKNPFNDAKFPLNMS